MKISFCTTCMGRAHHLRSTLLQNIENNLGKNGPEVEFVVLDYNSRDDLKDWILGDPALAPHLKSGVLKYARNPAPETFHHAHAKNMAHRLATGDVVCNLDADNFTGPGFARYLADAFTANPESIVSPQLSIVRDFPLEERGFFGRIAMTKANFMKLGGYDEKLKGWGFEDTDFIIRALAMGLKSKAFDDPAFIRVVPHSHEERFANATEKARKAAIEKIADSSRKDSARLGVGKAKSILSALFNIQRNKGRHFGEGPVELGARAIPHVIGPVDAAPPSPRHVIQGGLQYIHLRLS